MFLTGEWDATSKLLENEDIIEKKLDALPYIKFNPTIESYSNPNKLNPIPPA